MSAPTNSIKCMVTPWIIRGLLCSLALFVAFPVFAETPMSRKVLVLYDSEAEQSRTENIIAHSGQVILNYLGIMPEYRDVNQMPLPDDRTMAAYRGVITTFTTDLTDNPMEYMRWLNRQVEANRKIVILGHLGATVNPLAADDVNQMIQNTYRNIGVDYQGDFTISQPLIRYAFKDTQRVGFERDFPPFPLSYMKIVPKTEDAVIYLSIRRTDRENSSSAVILTNKFGGIALHNFIYWQDPVTFKRQWYLNPFIFFTEALALGSMPVPDPTTLNGLRVAFSHIDGDAFAGLSRIDKKSYCAEIIRDDILKKYDFPATVSVIVGEIAPEAKGNPALVALAKEIFRLPNVEPASHSYSHPFYWDPDSADDAARYNQQYGIIIPGYDFDAKMEIEGSMQYISERLAPPEKPCRIFQWTGNCKPLESQIAVCDALGYSNINGGDTVFDEVNDSYTFVAPYYRKVGRRYQIHTGQANENILTNLWKGPHYGYREIIATMEKTGDPRRIAPINIYYHFYSAEYKSSLRALQDVYEWVLDQEVAPIFTSEYLKMMEGYLQAQIFEQGSGRYVIRNYGDCLTVRFDSEEKVPDLSLCRNVLGYTKTRQGLFVSLVPGAPEAVVALSDVLPEKTRGQSLPYPRKATGWVENFQIRGNSLRLNYRGFGTGWLELAGFSEKQVVDAKGTALGNRLMRLSSDENGILTVKNIKSGHLEISWK